MTDLPLPEDDSDFSSPAHQALRELRARAERRRLVTQAPAPDTPAEMQQLVQDLQIHQIELEMQYEELLVAQTEAEAGRAQYQELYEFAPVGYCTLGPDGTLHQLNLRTAQLLGTVRQQLQGRRLALFVAPASRADFADYLLHLLHLSPPHSIILPMQRPDGQPLELRLEGTRSLDPNGQPHLRLALLDVTEQQQATRALALSEQRFRTLFEHNQDAMLLLRDNRFVDCNAAALRLLGLPDKSTLVGRHAGDFSPEQQPGGQPSRERANELWQHTLRHGHGRFQWCRQRANGEEFWEDVVQTVIPDSGGALVHATWRDISAEKHAARLLEESEQRLRQALDAAALGVIDWNLDTDAWYGDARARTVLGLPPGSAPQSAATVRARLHPTDLDQFQQLLAARPAGRPVTRELEFRVRRADGTEGHVSLVGHLEASATFPAGRLLGLVRDRTRHRVAERELSYKNRLLEHILANMPVLLGRLSPEGDYRELIGAGLHRLGLAGNELVGQSVYDLFPVLADSTRRLLAGEQVNFMAATQHAGEPVYFQNYGFFDTERNEGIVFAIDITERERHREDLEQQQKFTQSLLDNSIDAIIAFDSELRIIAWNTQTAVFSGIPARQALGQLCADVIPKIAHDPTFQRLVQQALRGEVAQELSWDGRYFPGKLDMNVLPLALPNLAPGVLLIARDVTQREQLLAETTRLKLREQQLVLSAILTTQEEERRRIAEALHNGVGQLLYATSLHLGLLPASEPLKNSQQLLKEAIRATRTISFELTPRILEDFGLPMALRELTDRVPASQLTLNLQLEGLEKPLASPVQIAVYRMVQELLNNIMKHAGAHQARIAVVREPDYLVISVTDDGVGFVPGALHPSGGIGLAGIRNRVELLGGTLTIRSQPARGTGVTIRLPVTPPTAEAEVTKPAG